MRNIGLFVGFWLLCHVATMAQTEKSIFPKDIEHLNSELRQRYAPDKRVALFNVTYTVEGRHVTIGGQTDQAEAHTSLLNGLKQLSYDVTDEVRILPDAAALDGRTWAIVNMSVCNLRTNGDYGEEQSTQALLGMPLRVLQKDDWLQIQTPDGYLAWVLPSGVHRVTKAELEAWNAAKQIVVTAIHGFVYSKPDERSQTVSDVVASNRLKWTGTKGKFYAVEYPDGRKGYIAKNISQPVEQWRAHLKQDAASIIETGKRLMGIPYMWGGTSTKGVDCSGFVRTTLLMHDIIIPRDASQQAYKGERIEIAPDFSNLEPGDLLFFGRKATAERKERVSHVAIYMGNQRFIHSLGFVREASFNPADEDYDAYDLNRLIFAARVLPHIGQDRELNTTATNPFYQPQLPSSK